MKDEPQQAITLGLTGQLRIVRYSDHDELQQGWRNHYTGEIVWKPVPIVLEKDA